MLGFEVGGRFFGSDRGNDWLDGRGCAVGAGETGVDRMPLLARPCAAMADIEIAVASAPCAGIPRMLATGIGDACLVC